jgi:ribosomal protein L28
MDAAEERQVSKWLSALALRKVDKHAKLASANTAAAAALTVEGA